MKKISNKGNLPSHVGAFAVQLQGKLSGQKETEFWEASIIEEFEKNASEIGYEIVPAMDMSTNRGYLVGFDVVESPIQGINESYAQLKMYFIEVNDTEFNSWVKKIKQHREDQQKDSFLRRISRI
jgi:hypothetical protein